MKLTKIYTYWDTLDGALSEPMLFVTTHNLTRDSVFGQQEHEVDIDVAVPGKADAVDAIVKALKKQQTEHRAEIAKIEDRIKSMLCLEHKEVA